MGWWRRTKAEPAKPVPTPEPERFQFASFDNVHDRAGKIWRLLGFVNDRMGAVPQMASYLAVYRDLDRQAIEMNVIAVERERCAKIAENMGRRNGRVLASHKRIAKEIRSGNIRIGGNAES